MMYLDRFFLPSFTTKSKPFLHLIKQTLPWGWGLGWEVESVATGQLGIPAASFTQR